MIVKAIITSIPAEGDNNYSVRVPFLEDNTTQEFIMPALLCVQPGESSGYKLGDVVFVGFEDNRYNTAIILGKLFVNPEEDPNNFHIVNGLKVTGSVSLPKTTKIGDYSTTDIFSLYQSIEDVKDKISSAIGDAIAAKY